MCRSYKEITTTETLIHSHKWHVGSADESWDPRLQLIVLSVTHTGPHNHDSNYLPSKSRLHNDYWWDNTFERTKYIKTAVRDNKRYIFLLLEERLEGKSQDMIYQPLYLSTLPASNQEDTQSVHISSEHLPHTNMRTRCTVQKSKNQQHRMEQQHRERKLQRDTESREQDRNWAISAHTFNYCVNKSPLFSAAVHKSVKDFTILDFKIKREIFTSEATSLMNWWKTE